MKRLRASIDIGTHTARLLIASDPGPSGKLRFFARKRAYIRLAEDLDYPKERIIQSDAINRTVDALHDFLYDLKAFNVHSIYAIATGVVRGAANREEFLDRIYDQTGIGVKVVSGEEEAILTAKGVLYALDVPSTPIYIFDLGGGSTEFFFKGEDSPAFKTTPLGAMILTREHLKSDPPTETQVESLSVFIDHCLKESGLETAGGGKSFFVAGTGGTVTTLAVMLHSIPVGDVSAEQINGLVLKRLLIETLFDKMRKMTFEERLNLSGLDKERAGIILAGSLVVIKILRFFNVPQLTVSLSDLLEGILINQIEGESNGLQNDSICLHV